MCDEYLILNHKCELERIINEEDHTKHFSVNINFLDLYNYDPALGSVLLTDPDKAIEEWDNGTIRAQNTLLKSSNLDKVKSKVHCRISQLIICPDFVRTLIPTNEDTGKFVEISGTVVRTSVPKLLEYHRQYICAKCKYSTMVKAEYDKKYVITPPKSCLNPDDCSSTNILSFGELDSENCKDYQEIKIQESVSKQSMGSIPNSIWVTLEDDLVDTCKPGDNIKVCGTVKRRWNPFYLGKPNEIELVIKCNYIQVNSGEGSCGVITPEIRAMFDQFWESYEKYPLVARDIILKSFCPQLFGLYFIKLAFAIVLAGGSSSNDVSPTGVRVRSESHLLLVGDPGTGKSQLLRFASKIIPRSVLTTGIGSTAAGLTVTAIREDGEWQLEAGALVMADGGICCIDEFNSMKEHDRTSIHEAMEQQTISVAKASIVCKLSTRCSILAACNPKGNLDPSQPLCMNIALASPLLSRFDLILLLRDTVNEDWDTLVADYILNGGNSLSKLTENANWNVDMLQAYFKEIKKNNPILTEEAQTILSCYYQIQRRTDYRNKSRTTVRLLDSLIRLSQGHARLMYHKTVDVMDAVFAIILVDTAMESDARLLNLNLSTHSNFPDNPTSDYAEILEIVLRKLELPHLLNREMDNLKRKNVNYIDTKTATTKSRFFTNDVQTNDIISERDKIPINTSLQKGNCNTLADALSKPTTSGMKKNYKNQIDNDVSGIMNKAKINSSSRNKTNFIFENDETEIMDFPDFNKEFLINNNRDKETINTSTQKDRNCSKNDITDVFNSKPSTSNLKKNDKKHINHFNTDAETNRGTKTHTSNNQSNFMFDNNEPKRFDTDISKIMTKNNNKRDGIKNSILNSLNNKEIDFIHYNKGFSVKGKKNTDKRKFQTIDDNPSKSPVKNKKKNELNLNSDSQLLKLIPSVNDGISDILNFNLDYENEFPINVKKISRNKSSDKCINLIFGNSEIENLDRDIDKSAENRFENKITSIKSKNLNNLESKNININRDNFKSKTQTSLFENIDNFDIEMDVDIAHSTKTKISNEISQTTSIKKFKFKNDNKVLNCDNLENIGDKNTTSNCIIMETSLNKINENIFPKKNRFKELFGFKPREISENTSSSSGNINKKSFEKNSSSSQSSIQSIFETVENDIDFDL